MDAIASRIIKARQYAEERDQRIVVRSFEVRIHGENGDHIVTYRQGEWQCECEEFERQGVCAHLMAMEEILGDAVETALLPHAVYAGASSAQLSRKPFKTEVSSKAGNAVEQDENPRWNELFADPRSETALDRLIAEAEALNDNDLLSLE